MDPQLQEHTCIGQICTHTHAHMHTHTNARTLTHAHTDKLEVHVHSPHLHHSYLGPLPLLFLFELQGSLVSGPAGLLDGRAVAEWGGGGGGGVSVEGGGATVITEGPREPQEMMRCPPGINKKEEIHSSGRAGWSNEYLLH